MIAKLELKNFTAFHNLRIEFSPKVNVIIGENSSGKTHLLKAAYALGKASADAATQKGEQAPSYSDIVTEKLLGLYKPQNNRLSHLYYRKGKGPTQITVTESGGKTLDVEFTGKARKVQTTGDHEGVLAPGVYIPTKEVLTLLPSIHDQIVSLEVQKSLFDDTILDLCQNLLREVDEDYEVKLNSNPRLGALVPALAKAIGGRYEIAGKEQFFIQGSYENRKKTPVSRNKQAKAYSDAYPSVIRFIPEKGTELSYNMTAEGYRKIGVLMQLLRNGCVEPGVTGTIFWDEPECNMNPRLIRMLVESLLTMSRNGQQVILTTHDYVLLKWFDLLSNKGADDHVRFHTLNRDAESNEIKVESVDSYQLLKTNAIASTFSDLYDSEIERSLGGPTK
jgi:predicted ATPase